MRKLTPEEVKQRDAAVQQSFRNHLEDAAEERAERARTLGDAMRVAPFGVLVGAFLGYRAGLQPGGLLVADTIVGALAGGGLGGFVGAILGLRIHRDPEPDLIEHTNARWRRAILRAFIGSVAFGLIAGWNEGFRYGIAVASVLIALSVAVIAFFDARL